MWDFFFGDYSKFLIGDLLWCVHARHHHLYYLLETFLMKHTRGRLQSESRPTINNFLLHLPKFYGHIM